MSHTVLGAKDPRVMGGVFPDVLGEETSTDQLHVGLSL